MKERHQVVPRTLCLIQNGNKFLFIEYSEKKGDMQGFYNVPGGHIEFDEGIVECAEKEIFEETGLRPDSTKLKGVAHVTNFFGKNVMMFVTLSKTSEQGVVDGEEGILHWLDVDELESINVFDDVRPIMEKIDELGEDEIFTAKIKFDGKGKMLEISFE